MVGKTLNVYGRPIILTDCDEFTRDFYAAKYGIQDIVAVEVPTRSQKFIDKVHYKKEQVLPPFNGWGTHEDSESNCKGIELKAPHINFTKFLNYDK